MELLELFQRQKERARSTRHGRVAPGPAPNGDEEGSEHMVVIYKVGILSASWTHCRVIL